MADEQLKQSKIAKENKAIVKENKKTNVAKAPENKEIVKENKKDENIKTNAGEEKKSDSEKKDGEETKKEVKKITKAPKRDNANVFSRSLSISLKDSKAIGKFIKGKKIDVAIKELEEVSKQKRAVPMLWEIPHRKGNIERGRYPVNASIQFIKLLKTLSANSVMHGLDLENTIIYETIPNNAPSQYHRFGSERFKRTHVTIKSKEIKVKEKK